MSEYALKNINNIPVNTFSWLGVNNVSLDESLYGIKAYNKDIFKDNKLEEVITEVSEETKTFNYEGLSRELTEDIVRNHNTGFVIRTKAYKKYEEPVIINYAFDRENNYVVDNNLIIAEEGSEITVIIKYSSEGEDKNLHNGLTRVFAKKGAKVNLIKVQTLSDESTHLDANAARLEADASLNYVAVQLGSKNSITNIKTDLEGFRSSTEISSVYIGDKKRKIDINYLVNHYGKESKSNIEAKGALMDESDKVFKGTIDFKKGASKAKGQEEEYAVLLSPKVRNRSVPLLLCTEDDVEGQHAASAGKIDENKLFYLMTRGFSEKEAKKLIIEAAISPIIDKIPEESIKVEIYNSIRRKLVDDK